jgi:PleD family two-component response regulator
MSLDRYQEISHWLSAEQRKGLLGLVRRVVVTGTRDIDIPLLYAEDKLMMVMPHTRLDGAAVMADRLRDRICGIKPPGSLTQLSVTASLSVASTETDREVSFGKMVQQAVRGLKEAELKGGNVVIICSNGAPKGEPGAPPGDAGGKLGPRIFFT